MNQDSIQLHKNIDWNKSELEKFDLNKIIATLRTEHYKEFKKPFDTRLLKKIRSTKVVWTGDEYLMFELLCSAVFKNKITCPSCNKEDLFLPSRHKAIIRMMKTRKPVRDIPRTANCPNCGFAIRPAAWTGYRNLKIDLRKYVLYMFISDDAKVNYPPACLARILDVSYVTAKRIIDFSNDKIDTSERYVKNLYKKGENHFSKTGMAIISSYEHRGNVGYDTVAEFYNKK